MYDIRTHKMFPEFKSKFLSCLPENYTSSEMLDKCWGWQGANKLAKFYGVYPSAIFKIKRNYNWAYVKV